MSRPAPSALRAVCERIVVRLVVGTVAMAFAWVAILVDVAVGGRAVAWWAERSLDLCWRATLAPLSTFPERAPTTGPSQSALRLERLAARAGLDLAPRDLPDRVRPGEDAARDYEAIKEELSGWARAMVESEGDLPAPPVEVGAFLLSNQEELAAVEDALRSFKPPEWDCDVTWRRGNPLPNLLGILAVHRLLAADATLALGRGDEARVGELLEAGWQLHFATMSRPELISQLIGQVGLKLQMQLLRHLETPPPAWRERLDRVEPRRALIHAFQGEAFWARQYGRLARPYEYQRPLIEKVAYLVGRPWLRVCMADYSEAVRRAVEELPQADVTALDPEVWFADQMAAVPRWKRPARRSLPNLVSAWPRTVRLELAIDLTKRVLELRAGCRSESPGAGAVPGGSVESVEPGMFWIYERTGGWVRVRLDRLPHPEHVALMSPLPLSAVVSCAGAGGGDG